MYQPYLIINWNSHFRLPPKLGSELRLISGRLFFTVIIWTFSFKLKKNYIIKIYDMALKYETEFKITHSLTKLFI
jgi:hypothetical protein